jgi:hypothetical protein
LVEHWSPKPSAQGSSPCTPATKKGLRSCEIAQVRGLFILSDSLLSVLALFRWFHCRFAAFSLANLCETEPKSARCICRRQRFTDFAPATKKGLRSCEIAQVRGLFIFVTGVYIINFK